MVSFKHALQILEAKGKLERIKDKTALNKIPDIIKKAEKISKKSCEKCVYKHT